MSLQNGLKWLKEENKMDEELKEKLFFYLEKEAAGKASKEERVKGYKVKVKFQPVAEAEKRTKREAVAQVILQALRRLKKGERRKEQ